MVAISVLPVSYGALPSAERSSARNNKYAFVAIAGLAVIAMAAVVMISAPRPVETLANFPTTDMELINVMKKMAAKEPHTTVSMAQKPVVHDEKKGLTMQQQYARIMQNMGYYAPWSRQNGWVDRVAIDNIRKANTPQALAERQQMLEKENAKFAKKFSTPHTSQYTGVHASLAEILDPKYQPWANDGPRKAYYAGY